MAMTADSFDGGPSAPARASVARTLSPSVWGGAGFLIGVLFWHFVGFWGFVSGIVFNARGDTKPVPIVRRNEVKPVAMERPQASGSCITLVMDRGAGNTRTAPCIAADPPLPQRGLARRQDLALGGDPGNWDISAH